MTRAELRDTIRAYLGRPEIPDSDVDMWIDAVTGTLNTSLSAHPRMLTRRIYTLPAGENLLPLPTDMLRLRVLMSDNVVLNHVGITNRQTSPGYIMRGDVAEIVPCPSEATTYQMDYSASLQSENWVMDLYPQVYLYGALIEAAHYLKDYQSIPPRQGRYDSALAALLTQGWNEPLSAGMVIRAL